MASVDHIDAVVVGAGVIGLAVARALARSGREVLVLERHGRIGEETSSRNSEVIHAGLYYPTGSLKALTCVEGRKRLYAYCAEHNIAHRACGKLVVATSEAEVPLVEALVRQTHANGVPEVRLVSRAEARSIEPEVECVAAMFSPVTGIVDSHGLMLQYQADAEAAGAVFALRSRFAGAEATGTGLVLSVANEDDGALATVRTDILINSAGLEAVAVARAIGGLDGRHIPPAYYSRGCYFSLRGKAPFRGLVYPVPGAASLGIHYTVDLAGRGRFGPDHEWIDSPSYAVDPRRAEAFYDAIRRYYPKLADGALVPDYAGVRPKIQAPGEPARDFVVQGPAVHGIAGLVNLFGIESPGLTASLALADRVVAAL